MTDHESTTPPDTSRPVPEPVPLSARLGRMALAIAIGLVGGALFFALGLPLPWMLGAMVATLAAVLLGAPVLPPDKMRPPVVAVIGVMLGSTFSPAIFANAGGWLVSLAFLVVYLAVAAAVAVPFYIRVGRVDPVTAFFSAMPGGITEMMIIGGAMGGDERRIVLAHAARIVMTIGLIAVWFRVALGFDISRSGSLGSGGDLDLLDIAILTAAGLVGSAGGVAARLPAPTLLGPMVCSAAVHLAGLTASAPPAGLVAAAQVMLGTIMGCRFLGSSAGLVVRTLALGLGSTVLTLAVSLLFATTLHGLFGQTSAQVLLAYAPGGLTEMGLVALAMDADVAYITLHHMVRIVLLIALGPTVLTVLARRISSGN